MTACKISRNAYAFREIVSVQILEQVISVAAYSSGSSLIGRIALRMSCQGGLPSFE